MLTFRGKFWIKEKLMKKILFTALITSQLVCADKAPSFTGFYAGGNIGTEARVTQYNILSGSANNQYNKNRVGLAFGVFGGYGQLMTKSFYLGGELYIYGTSTNKSENLIDQNSSAQQVKYERGAVFGCAVRLGHILDINTLAYAKLGAELSKDTATYTNNGNTLVKVSQTIPAFAPGFGFEHKFNRIIGGIEYSYSIGRKTGKKYANDASKLNVQRKSHNVTFRIAYRF